MKTRNNDKFYKVVSIMCPQCLEMVDILMTRKEYQKYQRCAAKDKDFTKALPRLSERELALLDGNMCGNCHARIFGATGQLV